MSDDFDDDAPLPPSKSQRKRDAHALQKLGERLVRMRAAELATLPLPDVLRDAIEEARLLTSKPALARQRQYIGKLMRAVDLEPLEAALERLTEAQNTRARLKR